MSNLHFFLLLLVMAGTTYAIRALPLLLIRHEITHPYIRAFLYYVPFVTLTVMTFPAALEIAIPMGQPLTLLGLLPGIVGIVTAAVVALLLKSLMLAALLSSLAVWGTLFSLSLF